MQDQFLNREGLLKYTETILDLLCRSDMELTDETGDGLDITTPAIASAPVNSVVQSVWGKIRQLGNALTASIRNFILNPISEEELGDNAVTDGKIGHRALSDEEGIKTLTPTGSKNMTAWLQGFRNNLKYILENYVELDYLNTFLDGFPSYDSTTHILTFTRADGAAFTIDLPVESLLQNIDFDSTTNELVITQESGSSFRVLVSDLIREYIGSIGDNIQITIGTGNAIQATLLDSSVGFDKLNSALQTIINGKLNAAHNTDLTSHEDLRNLIGGIETNISNHTHPYSDVKASSAGLLGKAANSAGSIEMITVGNGLSLQSGSLSTDGNFLKRESTSDSVGLYTVQNFTNTAAAIAYSEAHPTTIVFAAIGA